MKKRKKATIFLLFKFHINQLLLCKKIFKKNVVVMYLKIYIYTHTHTQVTHTFETKYIKTLFKTVKKRIFFLRENISSSTEKIENTKKQK